MESALYHGSVRHRRFAPVANAFRYSLFLVYLDLAELDEVFRGRWLWSTRRPAPARFRRDDHLGPADVPLDEAVRALVSARTGRRPSGPIRLLTHLRYFGYVLNPVSFYFCYDVDRHLQALVAEVHNTPWGEEHCYVVECEDESGQHTLAKEFHVSPFLEMDLTYRWTISEPGERLTIQMDVIRRQQRLLDVSLQLDRRPITGRTLAGALLRHPFITGKVVAAIYWQALRLRMKGCPFRPHPAHRHVPKASTP